MHKFHYPLIIYHFYFIIYRLYDTQISRYLEQQAEDEQTQQDSPAGDKQSESEQEEQPSTQLNGNFSVLQRIIETGEIVDIEASLLSRLEWLGQHIP